jgi:curved DNA-binding protein CbpA
MNGQLTEQPFGEILAELLRTHANGILKVDRDKQSKAIFIEEGSPVFALSNAPEDQLGDLLVREGLLTPDQIGQLGAGANVQQLAQKLAESGLISANNLDTALQKLSYNAIMAIFEWQNGEFNFEKKERSRLSMTGKLKIPAAYMILAGARRLQNEAQVRAPFANPNCMIKPVAESRELIAGAQLEAAEGILLSRITDPISLQNAASLLGMPEAQLLRALYALYCAGFLQLEGGTAAKPSASASSRPAASAPPKPEKPAAKPEAAKSPAGGEGDFDEVKFQQEVTRMLAFFASADYYDMLGVTRRAEEGEIKKSYYQLAKKYHPDRIHKSSSTELKTSLEKVFAKITEAYEKLKDPDTRKRYDEQIRGKEPRGGAPARTPTQQPARPPQPQPQPQQPAPQPRPTPPQPTAPPPAANPRPAAAPAAQPAAPTAQAAASRPVAAKAEAAPAGKATAAAPVNKPARTPEMAEASFNQGKQALAQQDLVRAAYLFREAVSSSPENKQYRQQLVQTLMKNAKWHKEAEENILKLIELDSFDPNNHAILGQIYRAAGMEARAVGKFKEALALDPKNKLARSELGETKGGKGGKGGSAKPGIGELWNKQPAQIRIGIILAIIALIVVYFGFIKTPPPKPGKPVPGVKKP